LDYFKFQKMTNKLKYSCLLFWAVLLFSCNNHKEKDSISAINDSEANNLAIKYGAITNWDSVYYYTSVYQEMFIEKNKLMLF
jgi:hypothetical protein